MSMNIKTMLSASVADIERCAGKCATAAELANGNGNPILTAYLDGACAALRTLTGMEYGDDEATFLNRITTHYTIEYDMEVPSDG